MLKTCTQCGDVDEHPDNGKKKNSICRPCMRSYSRDHYRRNKQYYIDKAARYNHELYEWICKLKSTSDGCILCGESHIACLQFHHRDSSTKDWNIADMVRSGLGKKKILLEIKKCDLLCANCHFKLHWDKKDTTP